MFKYEKILVPFDCLPALDDTLAPAFSIALAMAAELVLLRVQDPDQDEPCAGTQEEIYSELRALGSQFHDHALQVHIEAIPGPATESVPSYVVEQGIDLVVLPCRKQLGLGQPNSAIWPTAQAVLLVQ